MDEQKLKKMILEAGLGNHDGVVGFAVGSMYLRCDCASSGCSVSCTSGCPSSGCSSRCESAGNNIREGRLV